MDEFETAVATIAKNLEGASIPMGLPMSPPAMGGDDSSGSTPANPFANSTAAFENSVTEIAAFLTGLQSVESQFAAAAATTAGAYQAAFEEAPSNFMGDENGNAVDPAQEFMTGAAAVPAALDTILAVGATELGSDDDMSGIVFAAETLTTGLDASGAVVAGALAAGADVFTAGAVRLGTEFMNNMAPDMGGSEGPGTVFADALEGGAMQIAGGIDAGANALTNTVPLAIAGGLGDGATTFAEQFEGGAVDLAAAIRGGDGDSDEDTGNGAPELDPSIITGNLPSGNNAPEFDPAMIAGQIENGITSLASMAPAFPTPDFPMGT